MGTPKSYGFGVVPLRSAHHFLVVLPNLIGNPHVRVYERFHWSAAHGGDEPSRDAELGPDVSPVYRHGQRIEGSDTLRIEISLGKWERVAKAVAAEFNPRLKKAEVATGKFATGGVAVSEDLGKELMVLLWAIKDADPGKVATAVENWRSFRPEERCWLYTMTNARHGGLDDRRGWRAALRDILCNGMEEPKIEPMGDQTEEAISKPRGRDGVPPPSAIQTQRNVSLYDDCGGRGATRPTSCGGFEITSEASDAPGACTVLNCDLPQRIRKDRVCNKKPFGEIEENGFFLTLPKAGTQSFPYVYEGSADKAIVRIPHYQWKEVAHDVEEVFNLRLSEDKLPKGKFGMGVNGLSRLFGKELLVLLWTLEQVPKSAAPTALRNWKVLMPEERWWLYTRTAASPKNWKKALREALAECGPLEVQSSWF